MMSILFLLLGLIVGIVIGTAFSYYWQLLWKDAKEKVSSLFDKTEPKA